MKKTLKIILVLAAAGLYTADFAQGQGGNLSDVSAQATIGATVGSGVSSAAGAPGPDTDVDTVDDEGEDVGEGSEPPAVEEE